MVLNHLAQSDTSFDKILENIPRFVMIKDKIALQNNVNFDDIKNIFQDDVAFIEDDGLKIVWEDKWVHIRKSNTEPIIRIISEAEDHKTARGLIDSLRDNISS